MRKNRKHTFEGLPMVDADGPLDIEITRKDIARSDLKKPDNCAIAVACKRLFHTEVRVHLTRTYLKDPNANRWVRFKTPTRAKQEIVAFDRGGKFAPGTFTLTPPPTSDRLGRKNKPPGPKLTTGTPRRPVTRTVGVRPSAPKS
jgi:hypothetical protein